jgi:hypothetical protein
MLRTPSHSPAALFLKHGFVFVSHFQLPLRTFERSSTFDEPCCRPDSREFRDGTCHSGSISLRSPRTPSAHGPNSQFGSTECEVLKGGRHQLASGRLRGSTRVENHPVLESLGRSRLWPRHTLVTCSLYRLPLHSAQRPLARPHERACSQTKPQIQAKS